MEKTLVNILKNPEVSLSSCSGIVGLQIKGQAYHETSGPLFTQINKNIMQEYPNRLLHGIIIIHPQQFYDTSIKK